jgi:hypothetical protein
MMPDQAIIQRQTGELVAPQPESGGVVSRHSHSKLGEIRSVIGAGTMSYDETYRQVEAYVAQPGRSPAHQKYLQDRAAYLLVTHDLAVAKVVNRAIEDIIANRPQVVTRTRTVYVPEPRKPWYQFLTGG